MHIAESSAIAAALAIRNHQSPASLDPELLLRTLAAKHVMLTFFSDVDVAGGERWIPAAEYFGTKGFFPDYALRANARLTPQVAKHWAAGFKQVAKGTLTPRVLAATLAQTNEPDSRAVSAGEFAGMLPGQTQTSTKAGSRPITRGEALLMMWKKLDQP
jgi:hypothetical protein